MADTLKGKQKVMTTIEQQQAARKGQTVKASAVSMVLNRWRNNHRIVKINETTWRKTNY